MSIFGLTRAFTPKSIAVIGASPGPSLGGAVCQNVKSASFQGRIHYVNPRYETIDGQVCVSSLSQVEQNLDLAIIATPAPTVPSIVEACGQIGCGTAVILSAGLGQGKGSLAERVRAIARGNGTRLIGPNCLGLLAPYANLNASFAAAMPAQGDLAIISQSGAIAAAMVEWGVARGVGFSAIASLGDQLDVDLGDMLDYFALDRRTRAILMYVEAVNDAPKFMSAARAASRAKPVIVLKSGRHEQSARAAATHTGALAGSDVVYDAAFRRAGLLRVRDMAELFAAAETLARFRRVSGDRLAILTNGGGLGVLAADALADYGYPIASLSPKTMFDLNATLGASWSRGNPIDIAGDADAARYERVLRSLIDDPFNDAILVMNVQTAMASSTDTAHAIADVVCQERSRLLEPKPVLACWVNPKGSVDSIFRNARVPHYADETEAIEGFSHLVQRSAFEKALLAKPVETSETLSGNDRIVSDIVAVAQKQGRNWLDLSEVDAVLTAYGINLPPVRKAADPESACAAALPFLEAGQSVAVKILSRDIQHKSDVDGVRLNLTDTRSVRVATKAVLQNAKSAKPKARIEGVIVQPMILRPKARELILGLTRDPTFGAVIVFGQGGIATEIVNDKAIALPPLDVQRARDLISETRISRMLGAYRNIPSVKSEAVALALVRLSQLTADVPEILEIDINPLLADDAGIIALDARIAIEPVGGDSGLRRRYSHFAIRPYPKEWERSIVLRNGKQVFVRPVRPEDEALYERFFTRISEADLRLRFFGPVKDINHAFITRLTQIDYGRAMAFLALDQISGDMMGVVRLHVSSESPTGEYAILLRSDLKGHGLGWALMEVIIEYARKEGLTRITGQVLRENLVMLKMCRELGFKLEQDPEDARVNAVTLDLDFAKVI